MTSFRLSDFAPLSEVEREAAFNNLISEAKAPANDRALAIKDKIRGFEARYEMTSAQMRDQLSTGKMRETKDVCDWLFWLRVLELFGA